MRWKIAWPGRGAARTVVLDNMGLDARWCLIHCTHMTPRRVHAWRNPAPSPACAPSPTPISATGFSRRRALPPAAAALPSATDRTCASLSEELRTLEYGQRLREQKRNRLGPSAPLRTALVRLCLSGGAQALGLSSGTLAVGQTADIVMSRRDASRDRRPNGDQIIDSWIFAAGDGAVRDVFAGGIRPSRKAGTCAAMKLVAASPSPCAA